MKTQKILAEKAMQMIAFFSSITGKATVMILMVLISASVDGFAVGEIFSPRLNDYGIPYMKTWAFIIGFIIALCLSLAIMVSSLTHRVSTEGLEGAAKQIAKHANESMTGLSKTLCNFSIIISLMSVGIFMFKGVSFEQLKTMATTPLFWCQFILFFCTAVGLPKSIVRFSSFMYIKHHDIIVKLNNNIRKSIHTMIDEQFKADDSDDDEEEESNIIKLVNKIKETGT